MVTLIQEDQKKNNPTNINNYGSGLMIIQKTLKDRESSNQNYKHQKILKQVKYIKWYVFKYKRKNKDIFVRMIDESEDKSQ